MPAKRLPWYKVWAEHTDHAKVCQLSDGEYRTWHYLLAKASQQPERWTFASIKHAATVTGRSERQVKALIDRGLLDFTEDGVVVHNAPKWQDKYPSDYSVNAAGTLRHDSANAAAKLPLEREGEREADVDQEAPRPRRSRERSARATAAPATFPLEDRHREYAQKVGFFGDLERETEKFLNRNGATGTTYRDWDKAWYSWIDKAVEFAAKRPPSRNGNGHRDTVLDRLALSHANIAAWGTEPEIIEGEVAR